MHYIELPLIQALLMLLIGLAVAWAIFSVINWLFISLSRPSIRRFFEPPVYYEYFCPNGHYLGPHEPILGTLCKTCIDRGYIKAQCGVDWKTHDAHFLTRTPPYKIYCSIHGEGTANSYTIGSRQVSLEEWLEANRAQPLPIPLPTYNPLPTVLAQSAHDEIPLLALYPVQRRIKNLEQMLQDLLDKLDAEIEKRRRRLYVWYPGGILMALLLLPFSCYLLSVPVSAAGDFDKLATAFSEMAIVALQFLAIVLIIFAALFFALRRRKRKREVDWGDARLSFIAAELLALVILPSVFKLPVTLREIVTGLVLDIMAEIIVALIRGTLNLDQLRRQKEHLLEKLEEVQKVLQVVIPTVAFVYGAERRANPGQI
jgi:hypothetical protein